MDIVQCYECVYYIQGDCLSTASRYHLMDIVTMVYAMMMTMKNCMKQQQFPSTK